MNTNFFRKAFLASFLASFFLVGNPTGMVYAATDEVNPCTTDSNSSACTDYVNSIADTNDAADASSPIPGSSPLLKTNFMFNPNTIAPTEKTYNKGTGNITPFLKDVANILLIVVSTGAVLSLVIGGFYMTISAGDSEKANKGKIIITYNIIAICIAMLSYGIIQFVTWIIGA